MVSNYSPVSQNTLPEYSSPPKELLESDPPLRQKRKKMVKTRGANGRQNCQPRHRGLTEKGPAEGVWGCLTRVGNGHLRSQTLVQKRKIEKEGKNPRVKFRHFCFSELQKKLTSWGRILLNGLFWSPMTRSNHSFWIPFENFLIKNPGILNKNGSIWWPSERLGGMCTRDSDSGQGSGTRSRFWRCLSSVKTVKPWPGLGSPPP